MSDAMTLGIHHLGLTVRDLHETRDFFTDVLGFRVVGERPDYPAVFVGNGHAVLTLWQAAEPGAAVPFDRKRGIGLHHVALRVSDRAALDALHRRLVDHAGVIIEFAPEPNGRGGAHHMMCAIPGGIRVEFIVPSAS